MNREVYIYTLSYNDDMKVYISRIKENIIHTNQIGLEK